MLGPSFQSFATRCLLPRRARCKQAAVAVAVVLAAAGCGGGGSKHAAKTQTVRGPGYRFTAPAGWKRSRKGQILNVSSGDEILSVTRFMLAKVARPKVAELDATARELAHGLGGT